MFSIWGKSLITQQPQTLAARPDLKIMSRHLRFDKHLFYNILEASSTWICVVVEEEEKDGEGDGACEDASKTLDIPDDLQRHRIFDQITKLPVWRRTSQTWAAQCIPWCRLWRCRLRWETRRPPKSKNNSWQVFVGNVFLVDESCFYHSPTSPAIPKRLIRCRDLEQKIRWYGQLTPALALVPFLFNVNFCSSPQPSNSWFTGAGHHTSVCFLQYSINKVEWNLFVSRLKCISHQRKLYLFSKQNNYFDASTGGYILTKKNGRRFHF